jgi:hypothetical protein
MKETNAVDVAEYAVNNILDFEPAFDWWVRDILKCKQRLIKTLQRNIKHFGYKFGMQVPDTVEEALAVDNENKDSLWYNATMKEMKNVRVAFKILEHDEQAPKNYQKLPIRMIFDIKMDFFRKARLVAGGYKTEKPTTMTYSSLVSRDSVCLAFMVAALNNLDIIAADIGNAYLNAPTFRKDIFHCRERIWRR